MPTSWLWIHSPDRHRGVDVVCSNRSLGLESTSFVVNERLLIPQVHQHKKGKTTRTTAENSSGEVQKIDRAPTTLACSSIDRRRRRFLLIHSSLSGIIQSTTELFWNLRLLFAFEWSPCIVPGNRKKVHWGEEESLKRPRISALATVAKKSVGRSNSWRCVCVMTRCQVAQGNPNKMAKLPRTSLSWHEPRSARLTHMHAVTVLFLWPSYIQNITSSEQKLHHSACSCPRRRRVWGRSKFTKHSLTLQEKALLFFLNQPLHASCGRPGPGMVATFSELSLGCSDCRV